MAETPSHDLFVSYAADDAAWVEGFLLPGLGLPAERVHSHRDFEPGRPAVDEYARAVEQSRHTLLVLSPAFVADRWGRLVKDLATYLNVKSEQGILVPLRYKPAELGLELRSLVALDFTDQESWDDEIAGLRGRLERPLPIEESIPCPYPGLRPFGEQDHERFFGREDETGGIVARLSKHPFLAVIGPSGSGKSSLVFAGLVPALRKSGLFGPGEWDAYSLRPGPAPMATTTTVIGGVPSQIGPTFAELIANPPSGKLLLVVDQLEEPARDIQRVALEGTGRRERLPQGPLSVGERVDDQIERFYIPRARQHETMLRRGRSITLFLGGAAVVLGVVGVTG
jgi:hypothetical protein